MKNLKHPLLAAILCLLCTAKTFAQANYADTIKKKADTKHLVFLANKANISTGTGGDTGMGKNVTASGNQHIILADGFKLEIRTDSVASFLPYFKVSDDHPVDALDYSRTVVDAGGTHFATANYKYQVKQKKRGDVEIEIKPQGNSEIEQYMLQITPTGKAELTLNIRDRAAIVYEGVVQL